LSLLFADIKCIFNNPNQAAMKEIFFLIVAGIFLLVPSLAGTVNSATIPLSVSTTSLKKPLNNITSLKVKDIQKMLGRKLTLKEKIALLVLKHKLKHVPKETSKAGNTALIFGIIGVALLAIGLFVGPLLIGSIIAAIVAML